MSKVKLISVTRGVGDYHSLNPEKIIAAVARHGVVKEDNGRLVKYLMDHKHWSPLQHVSFGFSVQTSRAIAAQIHRHFSLEHQELSQRYSETIEIEPIELRAEHPTNRQSSTEVINPEMFYWANDTVPSSGFANDIVKRHIVETIRLYQNLIKAGVAKECARMVLPMATTTKLHITGNLRNLLSFLNVRAHEDTQKELRDIATSIGEILELHLPKVFESIDWRKGLFM